MANLSRLYIVGLNMAETRLEKYKRYRESLNEVKANNANQEAKEVTRTRIVTDGTNTTSTLPLDEVLGQIDQKEEETSSRMLTVKRLKIGLLILLGLLIVAGIIVFAIIAWRN